MEILDSGYFESPENEWGRFIVSSTMKKEINRCMKIALKSIFGDKINTSKIYVKFLCNSGDFYAKCKSRSSLYLIPDSVNNKVSYTNNFLVGYKPAFVHFPKLTIENLKGDWPFLDPTEEVESNSLNMSLEFDEGDFRSIIKLIEKDELRKNGTQLDGFRFEVRVKDSNVDCKYKIYFEEDFLTIEDFIENFAKIVNSYNQNSENETHIPVLSSPDPNSLKKKVFDKEAVENYFKYFFQYDVFKNTDKIKEVNNYIENAVEEHRLSIEEHNAKLGETPAPSYIIPNGFIHNFNVKQHNKSSVILNVDLGSSNYGFDYILSKLDESNYPIQKIEIKG